MREESYIYYDMTESDFLKHRNKCKVIAYKIKTEHLTQCFLRVIDTKLVGRFQFSASELLHSGEEFAKVNEEIYNKYLDILNGKSRVPLKSLERMI